MKSIPIILLLSFVMAASVPTVASCPVSNDCIEVYLIMQCTEPAVQPIQRTDIAARLFDVDGNRMTDKTMFVSDTSPNQVIYAVVFFALNKQHRYQTHLLTRDGLFLDWSDVSKPPQAFSSLYEYTCATNKIYLPLAAGGVAQ